MSVNVGESSSTCLDGDATDETEAERLRALRALNLLDTAPEERFDNITALTQRLFSVPVAVVSLVDEGRQWFKSKQGVEVSETPREVAFCAHAIRQNEVMVVEDATQDARFCDNPLVTGDFSIRFYAGAPVRAPSGHNLGSLCIIDTKSRSLGEEEISLLRQLADCVEREIALSRLIDLTRDLDVARQEAEEAREKAEEATKTKDKFVSLIAHDLRSPISTIQGMAGLILANPEDVVDKVLRSQVDTIRSLSDQILHMLGELLDLARLQAGTIVVKPAFLDARYVLEDVIARIDHLAHKKAIRIENDLPPRTRIFADRTLIGQVLQNLLSNAVKFSHEGGSVRFYLPEDKPGVIACADQGVGVSADLREKLFLLEEKTATTGTSGEPGTGFGLPLSHQIVEAHSGELFFQSGEDGGSVFMVELPVVRPKVLLVDDDPMIRALLKAHLMQDGIDVTEADTGREALDSLEASELPDLVICDISMPEMDGVEFLRAVRASPQHEALPVIMLTGVDDLDVQEKCLKIGANDFTNKPIDIPSFLPRIRLYTG
ncbi:MAG: response regulator [Magnetovibrionaceae bacterium]